MFWAGLVIVLMVFIAVFKISVEGNLQLFSDITTCPDCEDGKIWDQAHDSSDLEVVNCLRCGGSGEISFQNYVYSKKIKKYQ